MERNRSLFLLKKLYEKVSYYSFSLELKDEIEAHLKLLENVAVTLQQKDKLIEDAILKYYDMDTFITKNRLREVVFARQIFCYLEQKYNKNNFTLSRIGKLIKKDHSTVLHSIKTVNNLLETDWQTKYDIGQIETILNNTINES